MLEIVERKDGNEVFYEIITCESNGKNPIFTIRYKTVMRDVGGQAWLILYDSNMIPVSKVFEFLNYTNANQSINSRVKSMQALKLLYSFSDILGKGFAEFSFDDVNNLKRFLKGISLSGVEIYMELLTQRSNRTVNGYLAVLRSYLSSIGIRNEALNKTYLHSASASYDSYHNPRYHSSERLPVLSIEVPCYISPIEFAAILKTIRAKYGVLEECIVRLMYQHGLRLGEVLGITNDDLVEEKHNGQWISVLYVRNRVSDKPYQKAKTCMNVIDRKQYQTRDYHEYGFQKIVLDETLYQLLNKYIYESHGHASEKWAQIYDQKSLADRVCAEEPFMEKNRYVFISCFGRPLRSDSWSRRLRVIFEDVGIMTDLHVRKHNLSHRFRHGFAMYQVQYMNRKELELMHLMRHSSLKSVEIYFKPTMKDQLKLKQEFEESLMTSIPSLKYGHEVQEHD